MHLRNACPFVSVQRWLNFQPSTFNVQPSSLLVASLFFLTACSRQNAPTLAGTQGKTAVPVTVTNAAAIDVPQQLSAIGTVQPYSTVSVKTQVRGILAKVGFKQGAHVKQGDLIFLIDPRPFEASRDQAVANLARDEALKVKAEADLRRDRDLLTNNIISAATFDQDQANLDALKAAIAADTAAITNAEVELSFCYIRSPINGRIGMLLVNEGNVVKDVDTILAVINQISPIYVDFAVPEQHLPEVRKHMASGPPLKVEASIPGQSNNCAPGELVVINNQVDTTGTILLRAEFANQDELLWPGQFVNATLTLSIERDLIVVPSTSVQPSQQGKYVCVVKPDDTADIRKVEVGGAYGPMAIVKKGLQAGERVVTSGQLRLLQGSKVKIVDGDTAAVAAGKDT